MHDKQPVCLFPADVLYALAQCSSAHLNEQKKAQGNTALVIPFGNDGVPVPVMFLLYVQQKQDQTQKGLKNSPCALQEYDDESFHTHILQPCEVNNIYQKKEYHSHDILKNTLTRKTVS